jgi:2-polyprenyl-3-methyl-5-hydroxy-6-metoxy-1,4-benzoquinol methylase
MDSDLYDQQFRVEQDHWWFRAKRHIIWTLVERYSTAPPNGTLRVCDIGCGTGANLAAVKDRYNVIGVESSPLALEYARSRLGERVFRGELPSDIDLPSESFDVVVLSDVLEHVEDDRGSVATAMRFRRYSKKQFRTLMKTTAAEIKLLSYFNTLLFSPAVAVRMLGKLMPKRDPTIVLEVPRKPFNQLLAPIMMSEAVALGRIPLPFGLSLVAVAEK